jgi:hypothetical protein
MPIHLSKSRFVAGTQCHKLLWWKVHEPGAVELQPDKVLQDRFDQGAIITFGEMLVTLAFVVEPESHAAYHQLRPSRSMVDVAAVFRSRWGDIARRRSLQDRCGRNEAPLTCYPQPRGQPTHQTLSESIS